MSAEQPGCGRGGFKLARARDSYSADPALAGQAPPAGLRPTHNPGTQAEWRPGPGTLSHRRVVHVRLSGSLAAAVLA